MKAKQQCGSQPSQWRLKDFVLWVSVSYQAKTTSQPNSSSSSCVPAFQPSIFSPDPTYFSACHTELSCALTLSQSFWFYLLLPHFCSIFSLYIWLTNFTSPLRKKKKEQLPSLPLLASISQSIFFTFPATFLSLSFSVGLLCSTYASQQSRFPFLRL